VESDLLCTNFNILIFVLLLEQIIADLKDDRDDRDDRDDTDESDAVGDAGMLLRLH